MPAAAPRFAMTGAPIDARAVIDAAVRDPSSGSPAEGRDGGIVTFAGAVRGLNQGRRVTRIVYEAYTSLAEATLARIADEAAGLWPGARLAVHHRVGAVDVGEVSVLIAAASPHRAEAFAACRYAIERIKQVAPIWKHEFFEDGDVWVDGAVADPDDEATRAEARRRACA